jgi:hypothetical protein
MTRTSVQSPQPIDVTSEDDEKGRATAVVAKDRARPESSKGKISSKNAKMQSRQGTDDGVNDMNVEGKSRLDDATNALPANFASTKRKSANFLDEILAEKANKKKRKKKKLKEDIDKEVVT